MTYMLMSPVLALLFQCQAFLWPGGFPLEQTCLRKIAIILLLEGCQIPGFPRVARYHLNKLGANPQFSCLGEGLSFSPYPRCVLHWFIILEVVCESLNMHFLAGCSQTILARDLILPSHFLYCL